MESVLTHPKKLKEMMEANMRGEVEEGGMTEEELQGMLDEVNTKPKDSPVEMKKGKYHLRGEGGSGERPRAQGGETKPPLRKGRGRGKGKGKEKEKEEESREEVSVATGDVPMEEVEERDAEGTQEPVSAHPEDEMEVEELSGGDHHANQGDMSVIPTSTTEEEGNVQATIDELKRYCEDQFASITAILIPLQNRIERLERDRSVRIVPGHAGSPPSKRTRETRASSGDGGWSVMDDLEPRPLTADRIQLGKIADFLKANPRFPTLTPVRNEKMKALQKSMGLSPLNVEIRTSDWTKEGIYTVLVVAHGGK